MKNMIITGNTYHIKDEIKTLFKAKWNKLKKGWECLVDDEDKLKEFCSNNDLSYELNETLSGDAKRDLIQNIRNTKAEKLKQKLQTLEKKLELNIKSKPEFENDFSFITQPILIGHHSEKKMRRLKERANKRFENKMELLSEIEKLKSDIKHLEDSSVIQIKGDAKNKRQLKIDAFIAKAKVGNLVRTSFHKIGTLIKINKNTSNIKLDDGRIVKENNNWIEIIGEKLDD